MKTNNNENREFVKLLKGIGRNIKERRKKRKLTLQTLATRTNLAISTVWELENGKARDIRLGTLAALAEALETDLTFLMR